MSKYTVSVCAILALAGSAAASVTTFIDRTTFNASLLVNSFSTVIDDSNAFAPDPSTATGLSTLSRNGVGVWTGLNYTVTDGSFQSGLGINSNAPLSSIAADFGGTSDFAVESPVAQGSATGIGSWGIDGDSGDSNTKRDAVLFTFNQDIFHFGADWHDMESALDPARQRAEYFLYDASGNFISGGIIDWVTNDGNDVSNFFGIVANNASSGFRSLLFVVGDDDLFGDGTGNQERWAVDRMTFGSAYIPTPGSVALLGLAGLAVIKRRR